MSLDIGASRCKWKYHLAGKKIARAASSSARSSPDTSRMISQWDSEGALKCSLLRCAATRFTLDDRDRVIDGDYGSGRLAG